ncbi:hypothetical protein [Streptomyces roseolus]|uniref:hypothetical protein n=1 Tax=Streptomyces roseolus TaxID=67358 RepID=UPI0036571E34
MYDTASGETAPPGLRRLPGPQRLLEGRVRERRDKGGSSGPPCTCTRLEPQPPRGDNLYWRGHGHEAGAVCGVTCPGSNSARAIFIPDAADGTRHSPALPLTTGLTKPRHAPL